MSEDYGYRDLPALHDRNNADVPKSRLNWLELAAGITIAAIAIIWMVLLVDRVVMPLITLSGVERQVPDLHHLSISEADSVCRNLGLELVRGRIRTENRLSPGTILDQYPIAGGMVKPGRRIEVVVSDHEMLAICPYVIGQSPREAAIRANSIGLEVLSEHTRYHHSTLYPEGVVMAQYPASGKELTRGHELVLTVSLGKKPDNIVAPNLVGRDINDVGLLLAKNSLLKGKIIHFPDKSVTEGTIISQYPEPGATMQSGESIALRVAMKPVSNP